MTRERLTITLSKDILEKIDRRIDGHRLRNRSHAIESILNEKLAGKFLRKAVMLGGGRGIEVNGRKISKLLLPIGGMTLVESNIEILKDHGIRELIFSLGETGAQIREKLGDGSKYGIKINYFERDRGTGSILRQAKSLLEDTFLMMNGDILLRSIDLEDMYAFHKTNRARGTILLTTAQDPTALGSIIMKGNLIKSFSEKPEHEEAATHLVNGGVYLIDPEACQLATPDSSLEDDIFPKLAENKKLFGYFLDAEWIHLHDVEKYNAFLAREKRKI